MKIIKLFAFIGLIFVMASCGGNDEASKVESKIKAGESLDQSDYTVMIDYCGRYAEEAQKLQDKINLLSPTSEEAGKLTNEIASLSDKFPYASVFFDKITSSSKGELGASNVAKINELAPLTWFSSPAWADVASDSDSNVVGSIVEMPVADTDGVIAAGAGEAVK